MCCCLPNQARIGIKAKMVRDEEFALARDTRAEGWLLWLYQGWFRRQDQPGVTWLAPLGSLVSPL